MNTNKAEALKMLAALRMHIAETQDFADYELDQIDRITKFISTNL